MGSGPFPLLGQGGVAALSNKRCEATIAGRSRGGLFKDRLSDVEPTTPAAPRFKVAVHLFCSARLPSLTKEGSWPSFRHRDEICEPEIPYFDIDSAFVHILYARCYSLFSSLLH